ncbi:MAG: hypothetical protein ACOY3Y_08780 [Acidobacteriota bacterium]
MRRALLALAAILAATAAMAASPYYLDRTGTLWHATSAPEGLVLTGEMEDVEVMRSVVPFEIGLAGTSDTDIQVAADEVSGKVAVVWRRNWSEQASEIMMAVWSAGQWERVVHLSDDLGALPRSPAIKLTATTATFSDQNDPPQTVTARDSFLHVTWWEGTIQQHGSYAALRLTAGPDDDEALVTRNLDEFVTVGLSCENPPTPEVLEHPVFASENRRDRALLFFGSERICLFQLVEVSTVVEPGVGDSIQIVAQRRRSRPVFGVRGVYSVPRGISMAGARMVLGSDLNPVAYRVVGSQVEYVVATDRGWTPKRTVTLREGLTVDQVIPLVEDLAR